MIGNLITFLLSLLHTEWLRITGPQPPSTPIVEPPAPVVPNVPIVPPTVNVEADLDQIILSNTESILNMPVTGGSIHQVSAATATEVANLLIADAKKYGVALSYVVATVRNESDFDPAADDPNNQDATPGETPAQAAAHADLGLAQEDVTTAEGDPANAGMTLQAIETELLDPAYASDYVAKTVAANVAWAEALFAKYPTLAKLVPGGNSNVLGFQAYNSGQRGALLIADGPGLAGNWSYGNGVAARAAAWYMLLDAD